MSGEPLHLFQGFGIEIEYALVDAATLDVAGLADRLLEAEGGPHDADVDRGAVAWSNELALHVIEFKTNGPAPSFAGLAAAFDGNVVRMEEILAPHGARLLPGAMHPWMDPERETRLWPHAWNETYLAFDRIFGCRGHGWSNLQSTHLNLPFAGDDEFARLHDAIRVVLPAIPALAASSPAADGALTGMMDTRLLHYRTNSSRVPSVTGLVIPERIGSRAEYEERILGRIYADMAPLDPEGVLRHEFANARGCIARFDRMALEIRVIDCQENPAADLAVAAAVSGAVRALAEERLSSRGLQEGLLERDLLPILLDCARDGSGAVLRDAEWLLALGWTGEVPCRARDLWAMLIERGMDLIPGAGEVRPALEPYFSGGTLAERILAALGPSPDRAALRRVYGRLADSLRERRPFA